MTMAVEVTVRLCVTFAVLCTTASLGQSDNKGSGTDCTFGSVPCPADSRAWLLGQCENHPCTRAAEDDHPSLQPGGQCKWDHCGVDYQGFIFEGRCWLNVSCNYNHSQEIGSCSAQGEPNKGRFLSYQCIPVSGVTGASVGGAVAGAVLVVVLVLAGLGCWRWRRRVMECLRLVPKWRPWARASSRSRDRKGGSGPQEASTRHNLDNSYEVVDLDLDKDAFHRNQPAGASCLPPGYELAKPIRDDLPLNQDPAKSAYDVSGQRNAKGGPFTGSYGHLNMATPAGQEGCYDHVTRGGRTRVINAAIYHKAMAQTTSSSGAAYDRCLLQPQGRVDVVCSPYDVVTVARK